MEAMAHAYRTHWPPERELLAVAVELLHSLLRVTLKANGAKTVPKPIHIPRPEEGEKAKPKPISMSEYARDFLGV